MEQFIKAVNRLGKNKGKTAEERETLHPNFQLEKVHSTRISKRNPGIPKNTGIFLYVYGLPKKIFSAVLRMTSNSRKNLYSVNHICDFYFIIRE